MPAAARTRTRHPAAAATIDDVCRCKPKPYVIATFHNGDLTTVVRLHNRRNRNGTPQGCHLPPEQLDLKDWR